MPCTSPLQGYSVGINGQFKYSQEAQEAFQSGKPLKHTVAVSCGNCLSCRVKKSRDLAVRCVHESSLYDKNCFVTLTFSNESLESMCPKTVWKDPFFDFSPEGGVFTPLIGYSLKKEHMQAFMKDLRREFEGEVVRALYCGEYGGKTMRPHYHALLFNCDFEDKYVYKIEDGFTYYNSDTLSSLWPYGHAVIADMCYGTAAYVGRYCLKKVGGSGRSNHYKGRIPEFAEPSRRPGLGHGWITKFLSDVYPRDELVADVGKKRVVLRPPRYYDKVLEDIDPLMLKQVRESRSEKFDDLDGHSFDILQGINRCTKIRIDKLVRKLELD